MNKKLFSKITSLFVCIMLAFTMMPMSISFAAGEAEYEFVLTADKTSVKAGEKVIITTTINGDIRDILSVEYRVRFDNTAFSVSTSTVGRPPKYTNTFESEWYSYVQQTTDDGYGYGLGAISQPKPGQYVENGYGYMSIVYADLDYGYTLDSGAPDYGKTSIVASRVIFTATKDVDNVAQAFELDIPVLETQIAGQNKVSRTTSVVQIKSLDMAAVNNVNALIAAIPATVTYADKAKVEAAKTAYTALGDAEKELVTGADKITAAETLIAAMETAITNVETLIAAIGDVIYPDSKVKIDAARSAYDALTDDAQKAAVDNYTALTEAEAEYAALEANAADVAAAAAVDAKIEAIGTVKYTAASKALIDEADAAFKALTPTQQGLVTKKDELDLAIATYKALGGMVDTAEEEFKALEGKTITIADADAVMLLDSTFDALQPEQIVALDAKLGYSSTDKFNEYVSAYETSCAKVSNVKALINAIGAVTLESGSAIETAENAYAQLLDVEKTYVDNHNTLTEARATYDKLVEEAAQNAANKAAAEAVDAKINAIGTVAYTEASKALIDAAKSAFDALTPAQQALVTKKNVLDAAIAEYKALDDEVEAVKAAFDAFDINSYNLDKLNELDALKIKYADLDANQVAALDAYYGFNVSYKITEYINESNRQADEVKNARLLIDAIGDVTLDSKAAIEAAEAAYAAIPDANKKYLDAGKVTILTEAREKYNTLVTYKAAADEVMADIVALTPAADVTKDNVNTVAAKAASARASYENLPDKTMVADSYLQKLAEVEAACAKVKADLAAAKAVDDVIAAIGTVSLGSIDKITAAEEAYDALTDDQKAYVTKLNDLETARATYDELKADQDAIDAVEELIDAIGDVTLDSGCLNAIAAAKDAYDALDADLQPRVENYTVLTNALATYEALVASKAKVDAVIAAIDNLGEITLASKAKIEAAEALYGALTEDEQAQVENYQTLLDARATYEALKEAVDKAEADQLAANGVDELIGEIGEVTFGSEAAIIAARAAYDNLTDDQKALVTGLSILEEAEAILEGLKADKAAIDAVIEIINAIGEVTYPDSKDAIDAAQAAYDDLADNLKDRVANYGVLTAAQQKYEALEADYNAVQNVITMIEQIGDVEYTVECKERIDAAYNAHQALREELRVQVTNTDVLAEAMAAYEALKPTYGSTEEAVTEYGDVYVTVFNNLPANKKVTLGGFEAQMVTEGENVYYVVLSSTKLDPMAVVVEEGTPETFLIGDTDGNGEVTALDAYAANSKSANLDVDCYTTDAMAFVRSDINGSASITAYDALMIARIAAGIDVVTSFVTGK